MMKFICVLSMCSWGLIGFAEVGSVMKSDTKPVIAEKVISIERVKCGSQKPVISLLSSAKCLGVWLEIVHWDHESAVCIKVKYCRGNNNFFTQILNRKAFFSEDGSHGWKVERAVWSPKGKYIALICSSSRGTLTRL